MFRIFLSNSNYLTFLTISTVKPVCIVDQVTIKLKLHFHFKVCDFVHQFLIKFHLFHENISIKRENNLTVSEAQ